MHRPKGDSTEFKVESATTQQQQHHQICTASLYDCMELCVLLYYDSARCIVAIHRATGYKHEKHIHTACATATATTTTHGKDRKKRRRRRTGVVKHKKRAVADCDLGTVSGPFLYPEPWVKLPSLMIPSRAKAPPPRGDDWLLSRLVPVIVPQSNQSEALVSPPLDAL